MAASLVTRVFPFEMVSPVVLNHTWGTIYHSAMLEVQNGSRPAIPALGCHHEGPKKHRLTCEARTTGRSTQSRHYRPLTWGARQLCRQESCLKAGMSRSYILAKVDGDDQPAAWQISPMVTPLDQAQEEAIPLVEWALTEMGALRDH